MVKLLVGTDGRRCENEGRTGMILLESKDTISSRTDVVKKGEVTRKETGRLSTYAQMCAKRSECAESLRQFGAFNLPDSHGANCDIVHAVCGGLVEWADETWSDRRPTGALQCANTFQIVPSIVSRASRISENGAKTELH